MASTNWSGSEGGSGGAERAPYPGQERYEPEESSLPWQNRRRYPSAVAAIWETIKVVLFEPTRAFSRIRVAGSLSESLVFVLIVGCTGGYIGALWQLLWHVFAAALGAAEGGVEQGVGVLVGPVASAVIALVLVPVSVLIGSFFGAAILHACLWLLGGAKQSFEATYAVVAYAGGCTSLLNILPLCGGLIGAIWNIVLQIIGLREAHNTTTARATLAVFLPMIVCCGGVLLLALFVIGVGAFAAAAR